MTETSLTVQGDASHAVAIASDPTEFLVAAAETGIRQHQFVQIKVPSGGGTNWEFEGPDGDESGKELDVIVAYIRPGQRKLYLKGMEESDPGPPDCSAEDGEHGLGFHEEHDEDDKPTARTCGTCKMNKFGSDFKGRKGKACSESVQFFAFLPGDFLPVVLHVPPASLKDFRSFSLRQMSRGRKLQHIVTRLSLTKMDGPPKYSMIDFKIERELNADEIEKIAELGKALTASYPPINLWDTAESTEPADVEHEEPAGDWTEA